MESEYVISNGKNFLGFDNNNNFKTFSTIDKARKFTKEKAENTLKNLPKTLSRLNYSIVLCTVTDNSKVNKEELDNLFNKDKDEIFNDIGNMLKNFESYFNKVLSMKESLLKELSKIDREIEDVLHSIEFFKFNASDGYKIYKILREQRIKRRKIKSYLEVIQKLEVICNKENEINISSDILKLTNKTYTPRELFKLFE